jgi:hypothetical protein
VRVLLQPSITHLHESELELHHLSVGENGAVQLLSNEAQKLIDDPDFYLK